MSNQIKNKVSLFASAEAAWPEDEASITADAFKGRAEDGYTDAQNREFLARQVAHMHKVFGEHPDASDLIARYDSSLSKSLA